MVTRTWISGAAGTIEVSLSACPGLVGPLSSMPIEGPTSSGRLATRMVQRGPTYVFDGCVALQNIHYRRLKIVEGAARIACRRGFIKVPAVEGVTQANLISPGYDASLAHVGWPRSLR